MTILGEFVAYSRGVKNVEDVILIIRVFICFQFPVFFWLD